MGIIIPSTLGILFVNRSSEPPLYEDTTSPLRLQGEGVYCVWGVRNLNSYGASPFALKRKQLAMPLRRQDVGQAFRSDHQLQQFVLTGVTPTGMVLGTGSYGAVEEVSLLAWKLFSQAES